MPLKCAAVFFGLSALGIIPPSPAADGPKEPVQVSTTQRVNFAPGGTIRVDEFSGYLNVAAWDQPEVEIAAINSTEHLYASKDKEQAARKLEKIQVASERRSDAELVISAKVPSRDFWARLFGGQGSAITECRIRAPRNSRLVIHHNHGYVLVTDMTGDIEAESASGDIVVLLSDAGAYSIDAQSKIGSVSSDFAGAIRRHFLGERLALDAPSPSRIYLRMGLGGITIKGVPPKPEAVVRKASIT